MQIIQGLCIWLVVMGLTACGSMLLPSVKKTTESPWQDFSQVKASFDQVVPGKTRLTDLQALGFDPVHTPNVRRMSYLEVITTFMPNPSIRREDLDEELGTCIAVREECYAYDISPGVLHDQRHGNVLLDMFSFRRQTTTTGWKFSALIVIKSDLVVFKVWSGQANIQREDDTKQPLGPLQNIGGHLEVVPGVNIQ